MRSVTRRLHPEAARVRFEALLVRNRAIHCEREKARRDAEAKVVELARTLHPRRKGLDYAKSVKLVPSTHPAFEAICRTLHERSNEMLDELNRNRKELERLAETAAIHKADCWRSLEVVYSSSYWTQGLGATTYARGAAELAAAQAAVHGVSTFVWVERRRIDYGATPFCFQAESHSSTFVVCLQVESETDVEILRRRRSMTTRELVKWCWRTGVNPRVYYPFLPHGYEERNGIDFMGRDVPPRLTAIEIAERDAREAREAEASGSRLP